MMTHGAGLRRGFGSGVSVLMLLGLGWAGADTVYLKSGETLVGQMLSEDAYELQIVVSRTASGAIRTVKIVQHEVIERWERDEGIPAIEPEPGKEDVVARAVEQEVLTTVVDLEAEMSRGDLLVREGRFEEATELFRQAIFVSERDLGVIKANPLAPEEAKTRVLDLRQRAYERALFAWSGQAGVKKEELDKATEVVKQVETFIKTAEAEIKTLERPPVPLRSGDQSEGDVKRMGSRSPNPSEIARARELRKQVEGAEGVLRLRRRVVLLLEAELRKMTGDLEVMREQAAMAAKEAGVGERKK